MAQKPKGSVSKSATGVDAAGSNIRVAVRIRPFSAAELADGGGSTPVLEVLGNTILAKAVDRFGLESDYAQEKSFTYDQVFASIDKDSQNFATQEHVFEGVGVPILENALDAYNGCLLAYGQTGSGKSHSVTGELNSNVEKGLLPRACERLFEMVEKRKQEGPMQATVLASYLEIYQEKLFDLQAGTHSDLPVRLHPTLGPHVPQLIETPVRNIKEVKEVLAFGNTNRAVAATAMNAKSSRSHAVFTIDLRISHGGVAGKDMQSKIHFVDLAGSEKQKKTHASGERLQEGIAINVSLSALSRVIQALSAAQGKMAQPPFRESKLTLLLKDALSGNSRTVLLACISPSRTNLEESITTLEFASRCKLIKTNAKKNEQDKKILLESLSSEKRQIETQLEIEMQQRRVLQEELERQAEQSRIAQDLAEQLKREKQHIEERLQALQKQGMQLKNGELDKELQSVRQAHAAVKQEWDQVQLENESKAVELMWLQEDKKLQAEAERLRQDKEQQVAKAEAQRQEALHQLEEVKKHMEEEKRAWEMKKQGEEERQIQLEQALQQRDADREERERLVRERWEVANKLHKAQELRKKQEEELQQQQEVARKALEDLMKEKHRQDQELQKLRDQTELQESLARERARQVDEENERANREWREREMERLEKEKSEQVLLAEANRAIAMEQLQEKLLEMQSREEQEQQIREKGQEKDAEMRNRIDEELKLQKLREEELKKELEGLQSISDSWQWERQDLERRAQEQKQCRLQLMRELGIHGAGQDGEADKEAPRLVNLHPDPLLGGCIIFYLPCGETRIGADHDRCDVRLTGLDVGDEVCLITNKDDYELAVRPLEGGLVRLNGTMVRQESHILRNGDRLAIGRAHIFRVVIPKEGKCETFDTDEQEFSRAMKELQECAEVDPRWRRGVDAAVLIVKRDYGTREANVLLDEAKIASEVVAEANSLLKEVPEEWRDGVSHYELAVLFEADGPPVVCIVARCDPMGITHSGSGGGMENRCASAGIWEVSRFVEERLPFMHQVVEERRFEFAPHVGDWQPHAWSEVYLLEHQELSQKVYKLREELLQRQAVLPEDDGFDLWKWLSSRLTNKGNHQEPKGKPQKFRDVWDLISWGLGPMSSKDPRINEIDKQSEVKKNLATKVKKVRERVNQKATSRSPPPDRRSKVTQFIGNDPEYWEDAEKLGATLLRSASAAGQRFAQTTADAPPAKVMVRPAGDKRQSSTPAVSRWPAAEKDAVFQPQIQVPVEEGLDASPASSSAASAFPASASPASASTASASSTSTTRNRSEEFSSFLRRPSNIRPNTEVTIRVGQLFNGRLGVRLKMEGLIVSGFDVPEASKVGWRIRDEILKVNGVPVRNKEEFQKVLVQARNTLPITFTVSRPNLPLDGVNAQSSSAMSSEFRVSSSVSNCNGKDFIDTE